MDNFSNLLALLVVYQHNLKVLHWKVSGKDFDNKHKILSDYYDKFDEFIDQVAELGMEINIEPLSFNAVHSLCNEMSESVIMCHANQDYEGKDALKIVGSMFDQLIANIDKCQQDKDLPSDILSDLDSIKAYLRLESHYKNKRRLK